MTPYLPITRIKKSIYSGLESWGAGRYCYGRVEDIEIARQAKEAEVRIIEKVDCTLVASKLLEAFDEI